MAIMIVIMKYRGIARPMTAAAPAATATEVIPSTTGSKALVTAPNTRSRITSAAPMPIRSPVRKSSSATFLKSSMRVASPAMSALKPPLPSARSTTAWTCPTSPPASFRLPSIISGMRVVRPSADTREGSGAR